MKTLLPPSSVAILMAAAVSGCMVGPDYERPVMKSPAAWTEPTVAPAAVPAEADLVHWWKQFGDPDLDRLVEQACRNNLDLQVAKSRIRQARAAKASAVSALWPSLNAGANASKSESGIPGGGDARSSSTQYQAGFDALWELDIFGGNRRSSEAAEAELQATVEDGRDVLVTVTAEVAMAYLDLRVAQRHVAIAKENLEAQRRSADLTHKRQLGGFAAVLDVSRADAQVATTAAQIPLLESQARQQIYALGVLLGQDPASLLPELDAARPVPSTLPAIPAGLPSELLQRRPDIRAAEARIHAATARIGVAKSNYYPKVTLTGSVGFRNDSPSSLLDWNKRYFSFGPGADWRIFDFGGTAAAVESSKAAMEQNFLLYRKTILTAFQEVENALVSARKQRENQVFLQQAVAANRKAAELSLRLYAEGSTDFLDVLAAQQSLLNTEEGQVSSQRNELAAQIALFKALGGGWDEQSLEAKAP